MPTADHLQLDQTFEAQRDLVNRTIVPIVMKALDLVTYPVAETIIYDMIHNRHKHQCEEHLIKQRSVSFQDTQNRRKPPQVGAPRRRGARATGLWLARGPAAGRA